MKCAIALLSALCLTACVSNLASDAWEAQRRQILDRPREVFYNTDGDDAICFGRMGHTKEATPENFKAERLDYCLGTETTTVSYCLANGIGWLHYDSKVGQPLVKNPYETLKGGRNIVGEFIAQGTDPMRLTLEFCREHNLECFACLRMNDTHDGGHTAAKPYVHWSPFKEAHPDALLGSEKAHPPYCTWTAVDFTHPAVQKYYPDVVKEICERYDVDGFEYDFMRHAQLFRSVANGGKASQEELDTATALMRQLRAVTEAAGRAKGHPVLVAVRVPDSVEYCRAIGIDIEKWLSERLVDILITTSYFQLNPWRYTVELAHRYGVKAYASLDESRIAPPHLPLGGRNSLQSYQAQAMAAMRQGMDGIYLFNMEYSGLTPRAFSSLKSLMFNDKLYYATYRGSGGFLPGGYLNGGEFYSNMPPAVEPGKQALVPSSGTLSIPIYIGDDLQDEAVKARAPVVTAQLRSLAGCDFRLAVNGTEVPLAAKSADGVYTYDMPASLLRCGENLFAVTPVGYQESFRQVAAIKGDALLTGRLQGQWRRFYRGEPDGECIVDGAYQLKDAVSNDHSAASLWHPLPSKEIPLKVKVTAKLVEATDDASAVLRIADGMHVERVAFLPGEIRLAFGGKSVPFDTTDAFHDYEIDFGSGVVTVRADGKELLSAPLKGDVRDAATRMSGYSESIPEINSCGVVIGSVSGPGKGTLLFRDFDILQNTLAVNDFAVAIRFPAPPEPELLALRDVPIRPLAAVAVQDGALVIDKGITSYYKPTAVVPDGDGVLLLHRARNVNPYFNFTSVLPLEKPPRFLLAEFTAAVLADGPKGEPAGLFVLTPARADHEGQFWDGGFFLGTTGLRCDTMRGRIDYAGLDLHRDNTYRYAVDTQTGNAVLWCNGRLLLADALRTGTAKAPAAYFGDGSGRVDGIVRFKGIVFGVPE